jgi:tetratricopeptide (TPR) repeat protein
MRGFFMGHTCISILLFCAILEAKTPEWEQAHDLYQRTEYHQSLALLLPVAQKDCATLQLIGQDYFMLGEYKKATEALEKAVVLEPNNAELYHWMGRAYGRRAESGNPFTAPGNASTARQMFERSVTLDPSSKEAVNDLFDFYLQAPGFLGGGMHKAEKLVEHIAAMDAAEGHYAQAQIDDKLKEYDAAEKHLREAAKLAPKQVGRVLDIAMYLAKRGQFKESEALFDEAVRMAPNSPKILFQRAATYVKEKRNLEQARQLLETYIRSPLTPDDPSREQAQALLKKIGA